MHEAIKDEKFVPEKFKYKVKVKRKHKYVYQVLEGQIYCADLVITEFVVWFGDAEPFFTETVFMKNFLCQMCCQG